MHTFRKSTFLVTYRKHQSSEIFMKLCDDLNEAKVYGLQCLSENYIDISIKECRELAIVENVDGVSQVVTPKISF